PIGEMGTEARAKAVRHARQEYAGAFERFAVGKSSLRAIRDLVAICHEEGIRVAFFIPPVSPSFRASFHPGIYSEGEAAVQALGRRLRAPVFPAPRDMADDEFLDGHHMLRPGAERYSRWLGENYIRPWIEEPATGGER
ncbi:MAG TPA: hypothetical protein VLM40_17395, partial [Gemmata sp.]|nr:hypothetical protein [Gemmata sp.]